MSDDKITRNNFTMMQKVELANYLINNRKTLGKKSWAQIAVLASKELGFHCSDGQVSYAAAQLKLDDIGRSTRGLKNSQTDANKRLHSKIRTVARFSLKTAKMLGNDREDYGRQLWDALMDVAEYKDDDEIDSDEE